MSTLLIKNGMIFDSHRSRKADMLVRGGIIEKVAPSIDESLLAQDVEVVDADGLCVLPGIIDAHTHYHLVSRGTVTADSFEEGSKLAAFGGVTTVIDFADHEKDKSLIESSNARISAMEEKMHVDFALHQGIYRMPDDINKELKELKERGVTAIKIFTTYKNVGYLMEKEILKDVFMACKQFGMLVTVHCEDDAYLEEIANEYTGDFPPKDHPLLRPSEAEKRAIDMVGTLAKECDMSIYIVHLSSKEGLKKAKELRKSGVDVIIETTPHYLFLDNTLLSKEDASLYVMTPPLREEEDNIAIQDALVAGFIDVVATDHCSFSREQKLSSSDCRTIYPGIPGTEELLPLIHNFAVASSRMNMSQMVALLSTNPAQIFGIYPQKGSLLEGTDADFILFDPDAIWTIDKETTHSASHYSVYNGTTVAGKVVMTYLRGNLIMGDDVYLGKVIKGQFVCSKDPLVSYER
jgi:dihydropyrimidinase